MSIKQKKRLRVGFLVALLTLFNVASAFANWTQGDDDVKGRTNAVERVQSTLADVIRIIPTTIGQTLFYISQVAPSQLIYTQPQLIVTQTDHTVYTQSVIAVSVSNSAAMDVSILAGGTVGEAGRVADQNAAVKQAQLMSALD